MVTLNLDEIVRAVEEAKKLAKPRKFKQSVDLVIVLRDVDLKRPENRLNIVVPLPHSIPGKERKVCVIAHGDLAVKAREAGADAVLTRDDVEKMAGNKKAVRKLAQTYDFFIAQRDLLPLIGRIMGPILGPRGKMPEPITPAVDLKAYIERLRRAVRIRVRDQPLVMCRVGTEDMDSRKIAENIVAVFEAIEQKFKIPQNVECAYVKLTMGPAVRMTPWK
ncbi:MAG: 50S ribosomal protein L1 [Thermoprotei archaeon]|nr:MAG: 50S ribosomal protein L1 [Thermoprotei archaeon]